jgi:hypothetical protein
MTWQGRIAEARYTSPSGKEANFGVESVSRDTELKTGVYTFPGKEGAHVQHQGAGARTFPLACIFNGETCMDEADAFEAMLTERGAGELRHPVYGTLKVAPTDKISREDDLVSRLNEAVVTVTFTETLADTPAVERADTDAIEELFESVLDYIAAEYAAVDEPESPPLKAIVSALTPVVGQSAALQTTAAEESVKEEDREPLIQAADELQSASAELAAVIRESADDLQEVDEELATDLGAEALDADTNSIAGDVKAGADAFTDELDGAAKELNDRKADFERWRTEYRKAREPTKAQIALRKFKSALGEAATKVAGMAKQAYASARSAYARAQAGLKQVEAVQTRSLNVARNALNVLKTPSRLAVQVSAKIRGYSLLAANIARQFKHDPLGLQQIAGAVAAAKLTLYGATACAAYGAVFSLSSGTDAASRRETVETANQLVQMLETVTGFCAEKSRSNAYVDADVESSLALAELVYASARFALDAAFALPLQKTAILDRDRQVIELCAEFYGTTDCMDDFIRQNNFNLDELEILPMGKEVSYYVQTA